MVFESGCSVNQSRPAKARPSEMWSSLFIQCSSEKVGSKALSGNTKYFGFIPYVHIFYRDLARVSLTLGGGCWRV